MWAFLTAQLGFFHEGRPNYSIQNPITDIQGHPSSTQHAMHIFIKFNENRVFIAINIIFYVKKSEYY
ncbi:MAG TPA: hypothetical protein DEB48_05180 [Verrucomicrobiales bacterium]|nr:hypothetical protein [Verrucomicrobiales bacterium]